MDANSQHDSGLPPIDEGLQGFEALTAEYYPQILRTARVMTGNAWEAEDLAQETFLQALAGWSRYDGTSSVKTWLNGTSGFLWNLERNAPQLAQPTTVTVERSNVEKELSELSKQVATLTGALLKLNGELTRLSEKLDESSKEKE